jgi:hypothetical protein
MQQRVLVVDPLELRPTLGATLFEHGIDQLVLTAVVDMTLADVLLAPDS